MGYFIKENDGELRTIKALEQNKEFLWGDRWSVEDNMAWCVAGNTNILFHINMETNYYNIVDVLPNFNKGFRKNPNCIKCGNTIFCMPVYEECIWCYELTVGGFQKIMIKNPNHVSIMIHNFWKCGDVLWAVSIGLNQIIEINIKEKTVIGYYNITNQQETIAESIKTGDYIYILSALRGRIYEFNIETKEMKENELSMIHSGLRTLTECGGKFWLSGRKKEIYIWEKEKNNFKILNSFPKGFGIYNFENKSDKLLDCESKEYGTFTFLTSIPAGDYIWFIPFQTNQILYIDKITNEINAFEIQEEDEDIKSIKSREMNCKYILQYIIKERYIGLYSLKNETILEIDAETMEIKRRGLIFNDINLEKVFPGWIFRDSVKAESHFYKKMIEQNNVNRKIKADRGAQIYDYIK